MCCTDMETWFSDNRDRIYRFMVYKKLFTPYEQEHKFMDESQFEDTHYRMGFIEEEVELGNGDWLLGFREVIDGEVCSYIHYYRLSDIQLSCFDQEAVELAQDCEDEEE